MISRSKTMSIGTLMMVAGLSTACTTNRYGDERLSGPGRGAAIGAAGGAALGALTGGNILGGAVIGAAAGAIVGVVSDDHNRYEDRGGRRYYYDRDNHPYHYEDNHRQVYEPY